MLVRSPAASSRAAISAILVLLLAAGCAVGEPPTQNGAQDASMDSGQQSLDSSVSDAGMDAMIDAGPKVGTCEACVLDQQCPQGENGTTPHICTDLNGTRLCLPRCSDTGAGCPIGFSCVAQVGTSSSYCIPQAAGCCLDQDSDAYGTGATCLGPDCNDNSANVNPGQSELCNSVDDDCDMTVDDMPIDCPVADCDGTGTGAYSSVPASMCVSGQCSATSAMACGQYACEGGGTVGTICATTCIQGSPAIEDDSYCASFAHCTATNVCEPDVPNGGACVEDSDCVSNHCDNGFCCATGNCCAQGMDCPGFPGSGTVCEDSVTCQGSQGTVSCQNFQCVTANGVANDTACDSNTLANGCGLYKDIYCTGASNQTPPSCPTSCTQSSQCDDGAFCNPSNQCELLRIDGAVCTADSQCAGGHCQNGFCCANGDCCSQANDCPASYSSSPTCDTPSACQGSRSNATCTNNICGTQPNVPDDSACTMATVANTCGYYPSLTCSGAVTQLAPTCATSCASDSECDTNAHCDPVVGGGQACLPDIANGTACDEDSDCSSNHCQNGFCCLNGDCCQDASQCSAATYGVEPYCQSVTTCQGRRKDPVCNNNICGTSSTWTDDDSGCSGILANSCGLYRDAVCSSAVNQSVACGTSCTSGSDCDAGAYCDMATNTCKSLGSKGTACTDTAQCGNGLSCVDGVCCASACNGTCMACNVSGHLGDCWPVPQGTDPAAECVGFGCGGYYGGWNGDNCQIRTNAPDEAVSCDGYGACQTQATVCPTRPATAGTVTCNSTCQDPNLGTCTGTTPGQCTNVNPGTTTCGTGPCQRTVDQCTNGAPNTCVPGTPSSETCNTVDDDCDGTADNNMSGDIYETNDACGSNETYLGDTGNGGTRTVSGTVYWAGDRDFYRIYQKAGGCTGSTFYRNWLKATLTVPVGAGSYQVCIDTDCSDAGASCYTVNAGQTFTTPDYSRDCGGCGGTVGSTSYIRVNGIQSGSSQGWQCLPYTLTVQTWRSGGPWC